MLFRFALVASLVVTANASITRADGEASPVYGKAPPLRGVSLGHHTDIRPPVLDKS
jgi:hypothetical protein